MWESSTEHLKTVCERKSERKKIRFSACAPHNIGFNIRCNAWI